MSVKFIDPETKEITTKIVESLEVANRIAEQLGQLLVVEAS